MNQGVLHKLWDVELTILDEIDRICKKHDITYYLIWGTLLGAVRHKGFIPWDDDIDIAIPQKDYFRFLKIAKKELPEQFFLQTPFSDKYHPMYFAKVRMNNTAFYSKSDKNVKKHHGIFVDVMPFFGVKNKNSKLHRLKYKVANQISRHIFAVHQKTSGKRSLLSLFPTTLLMRAVIFLMKGKGKTWYCDGCYFDSENFEPKTTLSFEGKEYPVPGDYDGVLRTMYGDYMQLPPEDARVAHIPEIISFDSATPNKICK